MTVDIFISPDVVIEYDGSFWHKDAYSIDNDIWKSQKLIEHGMSVIRLREKPLPLLNVHHPKLQQFGVEAVYTKDSWMWLRDLIFEEMDKND